MVVGALLAAFLAGCGDDESTTSASTGASSTQSTATTATTTATGSTTSTSTTTTNTTTQPADAPAQTAEDAARAVLTADGTPKQACETYVTTAFVAISYGSKKNCLTARTPDALARSIDIRSSKETPVGVHLVVVPDRGPYDGAKVEVEVIGESGSFRVDSLQAHIPAGP